ncbi:MAG: glycoside hydrolase family 172 protein [Bacteroidota bacterium]
MKNYVILLLAFLFGLISCDNDRDEDKFNGLDLNMGNLYRMSDAQSRSISPENFTGEKGKGGMATLEEGNAAHAASELGQGWKVNPYIFIEPGEEYTLAEVEGEGAIQHIWMTPVCDFRLVIIRFYWDDETEPSVEVPVGDFFASGWGRSALPQITSQAVCVNPGSGLNSYWQMPFRKKFRITMENRSNDRASLYYQIDYTLTDISDDAGYFHAQFNRIHAVPKDDVYTITDNIKGKGHYVGTYIARGTFDHGWWGEGEIKFYMDGDKEFPTICGTGEEDYFCGSYGFAMHRDENGVNQYESFDSPYSGFHYFPDDPEISYVTRLGEYRWHILDPIRFESDLKVTIQSLGWKKGGLYNTLEDDMASVAFWYQQEPHNPFPELPANDKLIIKKKNPNPAKTE